jgi:hypothetical protein
MASPDGFLMFCPCLKSIVLIVAPSPFPIPLPPQSASSRDTEARKKAREPWLF